MVPAFSISSGCASAVAMRIQGDQPSLGGEANEIGKAFIGGDAADGVVRSQKLGDGRGINRRHSWEVCADRVFFAGGMPPKGTECAPGRQLRAGRIVSPVPTHRDVAAVRKSSSHFRSSDRLRQQGAPAVRFGDSVASAAEQPAHRSSPGSRLTAALVGAALLGTLGWSYWPSLVEMANAWESQADYSHGYIVLPIALAFLWMRRSEFPVDTAPARWGWLVLSAAIGIRVWAAARFLDTVDALTIPIWIAGAVALLGGWKLLRWSGPAIAFLYFMFPLPFSAERAMSRPLQSIATQISTEALQLLGQPAIAEGNAILLGDQVFEVEQACSGLRIFLGIFALAFACVLLSRRPWWEKCLVLACAAPIALIANATRIVATALLHEYVSGEAARAFTHDFSGYVMIVFAALLFWAFLTYLSRLIPEYELLDASRMMSGATTTASAALRPRD